MMTGLCLQLLLFMKRADEEYQEYLVEKHDLELRGK